MCFRAMPTYKLYYFNRTAVGEGIHLLLGYGDQEFEECRLKKEDWPALKPLMPFGQVPVLEIDGKQYALSTAIARYLGRKYGLAGKDIEEDFQIDQIIEFYNDIRNRASATFHETDKNIKARIQEDNEKNHYPFMLKRLDEIITKNYGHMALGKLTWADFVFAGMYDCLKLLLHISDLDKKYPSFKKLQEKVLTIPEVKAFREKNP
nr:glutathione S-transferase 2-like [Vanessa tameamea]